MFPHDWFTVNVFAELLITIKRMKSNEYICLLYFQIIFALVPPPHIGGGYPSFLIALCMIGILTAIVGDLAGIFGCLVRLLNQTTSTIMFIIYCNKMFLYMWIVDASGLLPCNQRQYFSVDVFLVKLSWKVVMYQPFMNLNYIFLIKRVI